MNILTNLREASGGMSRHALAKEAGLHHSVVNRFESGEGNLSAESMEKIAKVISSKLQLAYIAGLFDRASSWNIIKINPDPKKYKKKSGNTGPINYPVYSARIRFTTKHKLLSKVLESFFGEGFTVKVSKKGRYVFFAANRKAKIIAELLLPYLVLKRAEALKIIELVTILENSKARGKNGKKVIATYLPSFKVRVFNGITDASRSLNIPVWSISNCCRGNQHTTKNNTYTFSYLDEVVDKDMSHLEILERIYQEMRKR